MAVPKNWPASLPYQTAPVHAKRLTPTQQTHLRTRPADITSVPASETTTPSTNVRIQPIPTSASHPAAGQSGLFAARELRPGQFILVYLGRVHGEDDTDPGSDYDLWLDRDERIAVDAARSGNEGRFANDYRGVAERPNAEFGTVWAERWGQLCVGFWVTGRPGKKGRVRGVAKGEEILVSYGKGFWGGRAAEAAE